MQFDYSKLLGRIKEKGFTQATLFKEIGMALSTLSLKLNNKAYFSQTEIKKICRVLEIPQEEIGAYFFVEKVQKS